MKSVKLRIVGHELVTISSKLEDGTREETKLLKVKLRGLDGNKRTNAALFLDESLRDEVPLGDMAIMQLEIKQLEMPLLDPKSPPRSGRARKTSPAGAGLAAASEAH